MECASGLVDTSLFPIDNIITIDLTYHKAHRKYSLKNAGGQDAVRTKEIHHMTTRERNYWERYFAAAKELGYWWENEAALITAIIPHRAVEKFRVLDLGCGAGDLGGALWRAGFQVSGLDVAASALRLAQERHPGLTVVQADIAQALPFRTETFDAVIACLALHYFPWVTTVAIAHEIHRILRGDGIFTFRVNSTEDRAHGAGQGRQVEAHLYARGGRLKRFFDETECRSLVRPFRLHSLQHRILPHLDCVNGSWAVRHKAVWDGLAHKN
jgi:SAM-dependent methyltransferase